MRDPLYLINFRRYFNNAIVLCYSFEIEEHRIHETPKLVENLLSWCFLQRHFEHSWGMEYQYFVENGMSTLFLENGESTMFLENGISTLLVYLIYSSTVGILNLSYG